VPLRILFWVIYLISFLVGFWGYYEPTTPNWPRRAGGYLVVWVLIGILGWSVFGPAVTR
jgi:membrane protein YdbS with pleckstrin-like domain